MADAVLVIVTGVIVTWVLTPLGFASGELRKLTLLRILRLYRVVERVHKNPQYRELWILLNGLVNSMEPLFWSSMVMGFMLFIFGIAATQLY